VVSLVPSVTETLLAWGVEPVAVTRFCEQPRLAAVGGTKDPDVAGIVALQPDVVVMDDEENRREDAEALLGSGLRVHVTHVRRVDDVPDTLVALAAAVGATAGDLSLAAPASDRGTRVVVPIWRRPWMVISGDTYGSSLLARLGFANAFGDAAARYPEVSLAEMAAAAPDAVLLPSEPYPFKPRHVDELREVAPVVELVDGQDLFWWGVRTKPALARLGQRLAAMPL
jgi:ABC-type Fe3+-hydroxamate transport system substrate-binding protein